MSRTATFVATEAQGTAFPVLLAIAFCHMVNDMMQSLLPAIYPLLKEAYQLDFGQIGFITLAYQLTASILQPVVGLLADKRPTPFSLPGGTLFTLIGLLVLGLARSLPALLVGACLLGMGSSVFHPESSRVARMAAGPRPGLAQSLFQVGGSVGAALGPLAAAIAVMRWGQSSLAVLSLGVLVSTAVLWNVGVWYKNYGLLRLKSRAAGERLRVELPSAKVRRVVAVLLLLLFSKFFYLASITSYYTFYLIHRFGISVHGAQVHLFVFLAAVAVGTFVGGPIGDRVGRKYVIWFSILGALPFTLMLPHVGLRATEVLSVVIGLVLSSAFSAIVVYGQELIPGKVGMISGMFFGFAFGMGGLGAAVLGQIADSKGIDFVYLVCAFLPALGVFTALLPNLDAPARDASAAPV